MKVKKQEGIMMENLKVAIKHLENENNKVDDRGIYLIS